MISETELNEYTKTLRRLLGMAFRAGYQAAEHRQVPGDAFLDWIRQHSDERADAARRFLDAAAKEGYV